ncbi:MAG: hypothetical protein GF350_13480 [Chitinivibrionales bacterium]|nr:hypothetical protein [Chitinivibrionales bacterium]
MKTQKALWTWIAVLTAGSIVSAQQIDGYTCTWVGNSFAGGYTEGKWVQRSLWNNTEQFSRGARRGLDVARYKWKRRL